MLVYLLILFTVFYPGKTELRTVYDESGELFCKMYVDTETGLKEGRATYYKNGRIISELNYHNDSLDGICKGYWDDGSVRYEAEYRMNGLFEVIQYKTSSGDDLQVGNFSKGNGFIMIYASNGKKLMSGNVENGFPTGDWLSYSNVGAITIDMSSSKSILYLD